MRKIFVLCCLAIGVVFTSCVPAQDLIYLQKKNDGATAAVNPVALKPYRVQVNDVLSIKIKALDAALVEMFNTQPGGGGNQGQSTQQLYFDGYTVNDHGNIRIPVLGEVNVLGFTVEEIRAKIEKQLLDEYFNKVANIFVNVKLAGVRFTVNGEINSPGTQTLFQDRVTVLEAVANAGDITTVGNRKEVVIVRQYPQGTEMHSLDLTDAEVMNSPYYYVQPNDYIYVKPLKQKTWGTGTTGLQTLGLVMTMISLVTTVLLLINR
ncbi:sugar transporter [Flavobacterium sp. NST-5]|uniref:Sugar transporter n=1 Tax=Flavobacterium ichthyis TaxID=2698827 RepID=A0ABW9Z7F8_9FLAO|nr:polysaccharide biosynthesis/export family protein [Flavobacterium ichthyis]NBL64802.1 sugar transporter [Flavobacterium ichthyis]